MYKYLFTLVLLFQYLLSIGQASHASGFYNVDSLYWQFKQSGSTNDTILIAVNCFSNDCFKIYTGGVWLHNRNAVPNTWENTQFTKAPFVGSLKVDTTLKRGYLDKVNVVRLRIKKAGSDANAQPYTDKVYFIGLTDTPGHLLHQVPVVHIFADSLDLFGPEGIYGPGKGVVLPAVAGFQPEKFVWNYNISYKEPRAKLVMKRDRVEKHGFVTIINTDGSIDTEKELGVKLTGKSSMSLFNKSFQVVSRSKYSKGKIKTGLFGPEEKFEGIRFRAGGSGQQYKMGYNELGIDIIKGLKLGEVRHRLVAVYLNGSYWSMAFAQENMDESVVGKYFDMDPDSIKIMDPFALVPLSKQVLSNVDSMKALRIVNLGIFNSPYSTDTNDKVLAYKVDIGSDTFFLQTARALLPLKNEKDPLKAYRILDSLIDINSWLRYLAVVDFLQLHDAISNNVLIAKDPLHKPYLLMKDFDSMFGRNAPESDFWKSNILGDATKHNKITVFIMKELLLKNPYCIDQLLRVYQDLLNTTFDTTRLAGITNSIYSSAFISEIHATHESWGGDSNQHMQKPEQYAGYPDRIENFFSKRYESVWPILVKHWLPGDSFVFSKKDTIYVKRDSIVEIDGHRNANGIRIDTTKHTLSHPVVNSHTLTYDDRKKMRVCMDSVPRGLVTVSVNSLKVDSTWEGIYMPKPTIQIALTANGKLPNGYMLSWKEFSDSTASFEFNLKGNITLTPILTRIKVGDVQITFHPEIKVIKLSAPVSYIIHNSKGERTLEGNSDIISIESLHPGFHVLHYEINGELVITEFNIN